MWRVGHVGGDVHTKRDAHFSEAFGDAGFATKNEILNQPIDLMDDYDLRRKNGEHSEILDLNKETHTSLMQDQYPWRLRVPDALRHELLNQRSVPIIQRMRREALEQFAPQDETGFVDPPHARLNV